MTTVLLPIRAVDPAESFTDEPVWQPDTTWLMDPAADAANGLTPGRGALLPAETPPNVVAGAFREGFTPVVASVSGYMFMPLNGLLGAKEFEIWAECSLPVDWASAANLSLFWLGRNSQSGVGAMTGVLAGNVTAKLAHLQNPAAPSSYSASATFAITTGQMVANTFYPVLITLKNGVLTVDIPGVGSHSLSGVVPPAMWAGGGATGMWIPSNGGGGTVIGAVVSDIRVSRQARTPGVPSIIATDRSVITIGASSGDNVEPLLSGGLHNIWPSAGEALQASMGILKALLVSDIHCVTPIATAEATLTGAGYTAVVQGASSGLWFDWTAADVALDYVYNTLGAELILDLGDCPPFFGGSGAPWTAAQLTQNVAKTQTSYSESTPPNDPTGFGEACADLVAHILDWCATRSKTFRYVKFWNEPDGTWGGTQLQLEAQWAASFAAIKAVSTDVQMMGLSVASWTNAKTSMIQPWLTYCAANGCWPDVHDTHDYSGNMAEWKEIAVQVQAWATSLGQPMPKLCATEAAWGNANVEQVQWYIPGDPTTNENTIQTVVVLGRPTSGSFTLTVLGQTVTVPWNGQAADLKAAIESASSVGSGNTFVAGPGRLDANPGMSVTFVGALAGVDVPLMTADASGLVGGTDMAVDVAFTTPIDMRRNAWGAAWAATELIEMQRNGAVLRIGNGFFGDPFSGNTGRAGNTVNLFDPVTGVQEAEWNVLDMWSRMENFELLAVTGPGSVACDPGIHVLYARDTSPGGKDYALISSLHYRTKDNNGDALTFGTLLDLSGVPGGPPADGTPVTTYLIDHEHSNAFDTGVSHADLETSHTTVSAHGIDVVSGGKVGVLLAARAVALLEIG